MIKLSHVSKRYPNGHQALNNINLHINQGEMVFLSGHSGAGKSTLFKLITRIEKPTSGQVLVDNQNIGRMKESKVPALRREIGVIFQDHKLLFDRSVFDNVALPLIVAGVPHNQVQKSVRAALGKVGLAGKEKSYPIALSGGEQQRVGIARAVIHRPNILLADEPTGNLDEALSDEIIDIFADFNRVGTTVLIATHDMRQVSRLNKRVIELSQGQIVTPDIEHLDTIQQTQALHQASTLASDEEVNGEASE